MAIDRLSSGVSRGARIADASAAIGGAAGARIVGTQGDDVLTGTALAETIEGGWGEDVIDGGDGDDWIIDSGGSNLIHGGGGNDLIRLFNESFGTSAFAGMTGR